MARKEDIELFRPQSYVDGEQPCLFEGDLPVFAAPVMRPAAAATGEPIAFDPFAIFAAVGEVPYEWTIATDTIVWGPNAKDVLTIADPATIATGSAFARLIEPGNQATRASILADGAQTDDTSAEEKSAEDTSAERKSADTGEGVAFQVQYSLLPDPHAATRLWVEDTGRWFADADGQPQRMRGVLRVINERHEQEEKLAYLSRFDGLTGGLNRQHLSEILGATLEEMAQARASCGFLLVAIDNLAHINECYGYGVADDVILAVAKRLHSQMRSGDCLGRHAGNQFGIILRNCTQDDIVVAAERLSSCVRDDVIRTVAGAVAATVTISGVVAPRHARTVEEIYARAQETLDLAKARQRGSFRLYQPNLEHEAARRENLRATEEIVAALNERRIALAFEPVADMRTRVPAFYECLMRISRADGTLLPAHQVIPVAERLGLVRLLDQRVLDLVIAEMIAAPHLHASLNVSPASTTDPAWWAAIASALRAQPEVGERLTIEITEMAAIHDIEDARGFVNRVKDFGCRIAIDDFGAGYTSFRNLRRLGIDIVKIDGAFVENLVDSEDNRAFVQTLIELAHRLGLTTVAEWVQDEETATILTRWGCDYLQGSLIGLASPTRPWTEPAAARRA